jgi:hypothetical protein
LLEQIKIIEQILEQGELWRFVDVVAL